MDLTIAIPTWNNPGILPHCLVSLTRYTEYPFRIILVNNGPEFSPDGVRFEDQIRGICPYRNLRVIQAEKNLGWQGGINRAFAEAEDTRLFCMLNDDVIFTPWNLSFWRQLCMPFQYPEVGAIGPSTNYAMGSQSLFDHRGGGLFESTLLIGFCMVVRSSVFAEIGGLDESLIGGDDLDFSILVRKAGYKLLVDRSSYVHHIGSQTGPRAEDRVQWASQDHQDRANNQIIKKHGVKAWYETLQSRIAPFEHITQTTDAEGDTIRAMVAGLNTGLDVGCGANKTVPSAVGVDKDAKGTPGQFGGRKFNDSIADMQGDAEALPVDDASQDYIVARHVFEHLLDPLAVLEEWKRVLKPGGTLVIACPDEDVCLSIMLDASHVHAYNPRTLERMLKVSGFEVQGVELIRPGLSFVTRATKPDGLEGWLYARSGDVQEFTLSQVRAGSASGVGHAFQRA